MVNQPEPEGKVAAVTGAASGIGLASAEAMLGAGARVARVLAFFLASASATAQAQEI
jgi:NAD(P)-dependent dehydrogenase (short-subunit alcohol dehydrogenase family)